MADIYRPSLRLRPSEQRFILLLGDLIASAGAMFLALYIWYQFSLAREVERLIARGYTEARADRIAVAIIDLKIPYWFYLLPLVWLLLMVDSYEIHTASNWKKTLRAIAVAPIVGILGYSLLFTINQDPTSLPRIGIGAFLVLASLLTLGWRGIYIRLYTSSGFMRRVLIVGAGKAGHSLADIYRKISPPPFLLIGFVDDDMRKQGKPHHGFAVLGTSKKLLDIVEDYHISDIVVAIRATL